MVAVLYAPTPLAYLLGTDSSDLPLDTYCHDLKEEIFYMIARLPEGGEGVHGYDDGEGDD